MQHFVYAMNGKDPSPVGTGTMEAWFTRYKWDVDDETFVPVLGIDEKDLPKKGDLLWFVMDQFPKGYAEILRVTDGTSLGGHELHYDTRTLHDFNGQHMYRTAQKMGLVTEKSSVAFFDGLRKHMDSSVKPRVRGGEEK